MAKLGSYYGLCPIIDQRSLLGINNDAEPGQVLVTLGKNIAIKYKLSNQKQLISWRTKDKFTSPVIYYEKEQKYCAVFNNSYIRLWTNEDETLDKHKKFKFLRTIHTLCTCGGKSYIVFQTGGILLLETALELRRDLVPGVILRKGETIIDVLMLDNGGQTIGGLLVKVRGEKGHFEFVYGLLDASDATAPERSFTRISLKRTATLLSGVVLTTTNLQKPVLLTLWPDGKLISHSLTEDAGQREIITIVDSISCKDRVTMVALNDDYVAMYAADKSQEGALLIIYNVQFKVTQCKQSFKMYSNETKLWCLQENLFLSVGQNLAVVPYHLDTEQLAALIGSHKNVVNDPDITIVQEMVTRRWDRSLKKPKKKTWPDSRITELSRQGWSEASIIEDVLPGYLESNNLEFIQNSLYYFTDIPDYFCVKLLNYLIMLDAKFFNASTTSEEKLPETVAPMERCLLIDKILKRTFSSVLLMPQLRKHMPFGIALVLLRYICYLLSDEGHVISKEVVNSEGKLVEWGCTLLDANYQRFLVTKDQKIVELLNYFNELVKAHLCCLDELQQLAPIVENMKNGKCQKAKSVANVKYSIEELSLY